jgi:hypothetical protein
MRLVLQYFDGCPNWETTKAHLESLNEQGYGLTLEYQRIGSPEAAEEHGFRGSPTVLIEGVDPFADPDAPVGLSCRMYVTESGLAGTPSIGQLERALLDHRDTRPV